MEYMLSLCGARFSGGIGTGGSDGAVRYCDEGACDWMGREPNCDGWLASGDNGWDDVWITRKQKSERARPEVFDQSLVCGG